MRVLCVSVALLAGLLVGSCSSVGRFVGDTLPAWAGGLPEGTPPRPGEPGYEGYRKSVRAPAAQTPAAASPATTATSPKSDELIDGPIH